MYGRSALERLSKEKSEPPEFLYYGTDPEIVKIILKEGLKSMRRHYVHLSTDIETAKEVGFRKSKKPKLLRIKAKQASLTGINFYIGHEKIWLADFIPPNFIDLIDHGKYNNFL